MPLTKVVDTVHVGGCGFDSRRLRRRKTPLKGCFSVFSFWLSSYSYRHYSTKYDIIIVMKILTKAHLSELYSVRKMSVSAIAKKYDCSQNRINYYLKKFNIPKRSISEALYSKHNPKGDPFVIKRLTKPSEQFLLGLGLGLYWGEGNKLNKNAVRLGNVDPSLISVFIHFLCDIYQVDNKRLRFSLQIFNDTDPKKSLDFWTKKLKVSETQFYKITVTQSRAVGTYTRKSDYGVLTVHFNNTKLRDEIVGKIEKLRKMY